jgi:hypothetical protein
LVLGFDCFIPRRYKPVMRVTSRWNIEQPRSL